MFSLRLLSLTSRRLGIGLAVAALAISTAAAPLSASAQENTIDTDTNYEIVPMAQKDNGPTTTPPGPNTPVTNVAKADLQVTARGKTQSGKTTLYHFNIRNNGPANAPQITGYKEAHTKALVGSGFALTDNTYFTFGLNAGQEKNVTVSCTPQVGFYCSQGTVLVFMTTMTDPNGSNDIATTH